MNKTNNGKRARLTLAVQYAAKTETAPTRAAFRKWALAALERDAEIALRLADEPEALALNRDYRAKDYATNVLTFPLNDDPLQGDIVLCPTVVEREAAELNIPLQAHYAHLTVHGVLHLQGYDHETEADAQRMEACEAHILANLGYADPYATEKGLALHG